MKKKYIGLVGFLCLVFVLLTPFSFAQANEVTKDNTKVGVEFEVAPPKKEENIKPPLINGGGNQPNNRLLPKTGELLSSLIIILVGISLLIFSLGIFSIKQLYLTTSWEV